MACRSWRTPAARPLPPGWAAACWLPWGCPNGLRPTRMSTSASPPASPLTLPRCPSCAARCGRGWSARRCATFADLRESSSLPIVRCGKAGAHNGFLLMPLKIGLGCLALLTLAMFFDTLIAPGSRVIGTPHDDLVLHFLWWREFGFAELSQGNLALWNPHIFSGAPFFGNTQSALLYPLNWLFLAAPLPLATNWSIALNAGLLGAFMYLWAWRRGLHPFAAFVSGALLMFCAPYFLHVPAGHLNIVSAIPWIPLQFLAIDEWLASRRRIWCLVGMLAVAMQILSGQPQYVYFTGLAAGGYALLRLAERRNDRGAAAAGLLSLYAGGALLAAVQLFVGLQATAETIRSRPLPFQYAASFNFPPENLVTFVAPGFFGDVANHPYWGRWYLWEACGFIGITGLALAAYGMASAGAAGRKALLALAATAVLLAFGDSTPLFRILFDWGSGDVVGDQP